jgi:hypothetical protein
MDLIERYRELGIEISLGPDGLIGASPAELITPEIREELVRNKPAILRELSQPRGWWIVTAGAGQEMRFMEPAEDPGEVVAEFTTRTVEVPHQEDPSTVDCWTVCEGDGVVRWWFGGRRERAKKRSGKARRGSNAEAT